MTNSRECRFRPTLCLTVALIFLGAAAPWQRAACASECLQGCDDQNACTVDVCDPEMGCVSTPAPAGDCLQARLLKLSIRRSESGERDQWLWKWGQGEAIAHADLADPTGDDGYTLCLYAGTAHSLVAQAAMPPGAGWRALGGKGYLFGGPSSNGINYALLKAGRAGKSAVVLKGKGAALPELALPLAEPLTVQLVKEGSPLCLEGRFEAQHIGQHSAKRLSAKRRSALPAPAGTIPEDHACNKSGPNGSVAEQVGAQMRRSGTEWATTCLARFGSSGSQCEIVFPGDSSFPNTPNEVPSITCPAVGPCDYSLGRVEWHAEDKFARKCTLEQWAMVWSSIRARARDVAPPVCAVDAFRPHLWGVYACFEEHFVVPLLQDQLAKLRAYVSPNPPMTPACEGAIITRMWWRLASDWIRHGSQSCAGDYVHPQVKGACGTGTSEAKFDQQTWNAWCEEFTEFLLPVYEGVREVSGKPY